MKIRRDITIKLIYVFQGVTPNFWPGVYVGTLCVVAFTKEQTFIISINKKIIQYYLQITKHEKSTLRTIIVKILFCQVSTQFCRYILLRVISNAHQKSWFQISKTWFGFMVPTNSTRIINDAHPKSWFQIPVSWFHFMVRKYNDNHKRCAPEIMIWDPNGMI